MTSEYRRRAIFMSDDRSRRDTEREREPEGTQRVRTQAVLLLTLTLRLTFDLSTQNRIICKISHGHSLCQVWTFWDHSCLSYAPNIIVKNALIDPVTLTFDLWTPNYVTLFPTPSLNTLGSFSFELCCKQTDRQTDRQKAPNALSTPTDIVGTKLPVNVNDYILYVHNNRSSGRVVVATQYTAVALVRQKITKKLHPREWVADLTSDVWCGACHRTSLYHDVTRLDAAAHTIAMSSTHVSLRQTVIAVRQLRNYMC